MATYNQATKPSTKKLDNDVVAGGKTLDFSNTADISGGDTVQMVNVPAGAVTDRWIVNVITAETGISGTINDDSGALSSTINLGVTGATFVSSQKVYTAADTLDLVLSGSGLVSNLKVAIQGVYSVIDVS